MDVSSLLERMNRLEASLQIQALKARYLQACDNKDCDGFRACFVDGPVAIDYGPVGQFEDADALVAVFVQVACHPHMLEWHMASNPVIELLNEHQATGAWSMHYQLINSDDGTLTQLGGVYADEYRCVDGVWKISATTFTPKTQLVLKLDQSAVQTIAAGKAA